MFHPAIDKPTNMAEVVQVLEIWANPCNCCFRPEQAEAMLAILKEEKGPNFAASLARNIHIKQKKELTNQSN